MHRHGYQGRKFGRERDQRNSLMRQLAESLVSSGSINTTLAKAKEIRPYVEDLVTKAKKGDLSSRRQVIAKLQTVGTAHKLVDEMAPKISRSSGYLRIERTGFRKGDNAETARISFVDKFDSPVDSKTKEVASEEKAEAKPKASKKPAASAKKEAK